MYLHSIPAYVYLIKHRTLGYYYWGSRTANIKQKRMPQDDLWRFYFTSSRTVKNIINEQGSDQWEAQVVYTSTNIDDVYWKEQESIKSTINDPLCLNKKYQDRENKNTVFSTAGKIPWNKGIGQSATKGENNPSCRPEVREKIRNRHLGKKFSAEHRKNLSISHQGILKGRTYEDIHGVQKAQQLKAQKSLQFKGIKRTKKQKENNSKAQKGKKWITNGSVAKPLYPGQSLPEGFTYGRKIHKQIAK